MATFAVVIDKCDHLASSRRVITTFKASYTLADVIPDFHPDIAKGYSIRCLGSSALSVEPFELDFATTLSDLKELGVKTLQFSCLVETAEETKCGGKESLPSQNAFDLLVKGLSILELK